MQTTTIPSDTEIDSKPPIAEPLAIVCPRANSLGLSQAYALRHTCFTVIVSIFSTPNETELNRARALCACVKAWCDLDERIRIHKGRPLPGQLRPFGKGQAKPKHKGKSVDASWMDAEPAPSPAPDQGPVTEPVPDSEPPKV